MLGDDVCGVGTSCVGEESPQILLGDLSDHLWLGYIHRGLSHALGLYPSGSQQTVWRWLELVGDVFVVGTSCV